MFLRTRWLHASSRRLPEMSFMTSGERIYITVHAAGVTCTRYTSNANTEYLADIVKNITLLWTKGYIFLQRSLYTRKESAIFTCHLLFPPKLSVYGFEVKVHLHCLKHVPRNKLEELITSTFTSKPNGIFSLMDLNSNTPNNSSSIQFDKSGHLIYSHKRLFMNEIKTLYLFDFMPRYK